MIRPLTCLCLGAALLSGLYLYAEKHRAELLDRQIAATMQQIDQARARSAQLETEWDMLNEPGRLQDMAGKYLGQLKPMSPAQFVQLSALAEHLPAVEASRPEGAVDDAQMPVAADPAPAAPADPAAEAPPVLVAEPAAPKPPLHVPSKLARIDPAKPRHVAAADPRPAPGLATHGIMLPLATPQPMGARVMSAMARPMHQPRPTIVSALPAYAPSGYIGSAIGTGRAALPPPVPLSAQDQ